MNQANSTSCNNQGMRGKNRAVLIAETALQKEKKKTTFWVRFVGILKEFVRVMFVLLQE